MNILSCRSLYFAVNITKIYLSCIITFNLPYKIEKKIKAPVKVLVIDNAVIDTAQIREPTKVTCL